MPKSKFFRVAVEGATASDGRTIERSWIQDIADGYDPKTYTARVNSEHVRGVTGVGPFKALGDVVAVRAAPVQLSIAGKPETRLALEAQIDPTADLVALNHARQKTFTSIEVAPNFGNTGKAGLVGLAVTDTPASLGTEALQFSVSAQDGYAATLKAAIDARKSNAANLFSAAEETRIELEPEAGAGDDKVSLAALFSGLREVFGVKPKEAAVTAPAKAADAAAPAFDEAAFTAAMERLGSGLDRRFTAAVEAAVKPVREELAAFKAEVERTDAGGVHRPASSGAAGFHSAVDY